MVECTPIKSHNYIFCWPMSPFNIILPYDDPSTLHSRQFAYKNFGGSIQGFIEKKNGGGGGGRGRLQGGFAANYKYMTLVNFCMVVSSFRVQA